MLIIPAIDIKDGHCVRLKQGDMQSVTVFSEDPAAMAQHWLEQGAQRLTIPFLSERRRLHQKEPDRVDERKYGPRERDPAPVSGPQ